MILAIIEVFYKLFILNILIEKCGTAHRSFSIVLDSESGN